MLKRINKTETRQTSDISGTLDTVIEQIRNFVNTNVPEEFRSTAYLHLDKEYEQYSDHVYGVLEVTWQRPETDQELQMRDAQAKSSREYRRKQYEQLKKEFDNEHSEGPQQG